MSLRARLTLAFAIASVAVIGANAVLLYALTDSAAHLLLVAAVTGVIVASLLGNLLAGRLAAPLEDWAATADRIGAGDRNIKFPEAPESSELGRLSAALRSMAVRLQSKEDLLQARVEERTQALVEAMTALEAERERLSYALDHRVTREDGTLLWIRSRGHITRRSPEGMALRLNGTNADVSLRKEKELRLREQAFADAAADLAKAAVKSRAAPAA